MFSTTFEKISITPSRLTRRFLPPPKGGGFLGEFGDVCGTITRAMRWHVDDYFCDKWVENIILDKDLNFREDGLLIVPRGYKNELAIPY